MNAIQKLIKKLRRKARAAYRSGWSEVQTPMTSSENQYVMQDSGTNATTSIQWSTSETNKVEDKRIPKKPVEVFKEIIAEKPKIDLKNIDLQIKTVKKRRDFMRDEMEAQTQDEDEALDYLMARKKYPKVGKFFQWEVTTDTKIQELCRTYKLKVVDFSSYCKNVPNEAVDELEKFMKGFTKVSKRKPFLRLIIDDGGKETKKDPILLAKSPFGRWYYILGAWDKEVQYVDDLIYNGK